VQSFRVCRANCGAFAGFAGCVLRGKVVTLPASNQIEDQFTNND
jgi:hypothetical protein